MRVETRGAYVGSGIPEQETAARPVLSTCQGQTMCHTWHESHARVSHRLSGPHTCATHLPVLQPMYWLQTAGAFQSFWHLHLGMLPLRTEPRHRDQEGVMHMQDNHIMPWHGSSICTCKTITSCHGSGICRCALKKPTHENAANFSLQLVATQGQTALT
jgi:hypothetical protein